MSEPARLHPQDLERLAELVAVRVADLLAVPQEPVARGPALVSAADVARRFGVTAEWVRDHADELGAVRLGDGPRPRLRFDLERVAGALAARSDGKGSAAQDAAPRRRSRRAAASRSGTGVDLLPVAGREGGA